MPIVTIQRRLRELGRLRTGDQVPTQKGKKRARSLDVWRITSPFPDLIEAVAARYGGQVTEWKDAPTDKKQWQVYTDTNEIDVLIPPGLDTFSQWYEFWTKGGCKQRCDGEQMTHKDGRRVGARKVNCVCPADPDERDDRQHCQPTTRMSVMLPGVPDVGVWRVESHGYYTATELLGAAAVAQIATDRNLAMPGKLVIDRRQVKRMGNDGKPVTQDFVVVGWRGPDQFDLPGMLAAATQLGTGEFGVLDLDARKVAAELPAPSEVPATAVDLGVAGDAQPELPAAAPPPVPDDDQPALPEPRRRKVSQKQMRMLHALLKEAGIDDDGRHALVHQITDGRTSSSSQLFSDEVDLMVQAIEAAGAGERSQLAEQFGHDGPDTVKVEQPIGDTETLPDVDGWKQLIRSKRRRQSDVIRIAAALAETQGLDEFVRLDQLTDPQYAAIATGMLIAVNGTAEQWDAFAAKVLGGAS